MLKGVNPFGGRISLFGMQNEDQKTVMSSPFGVRIVLATRDGWCVHTGVIYFKTVE